MGKRNKALAHQKRKQKKALATTRRRANLTKPLVRKPTVQTVPDTFDETQHLFWMCHGVNFIVSNYAEGIWSPLFEGIYEGQLPSPAEVGRTIMNHFGPDSDKWPPEGLYAMGWTMQPRSTIYVYVSVALQKAQKAENPAEIIMKPANPFAWETFNLLHNELSNRSRKAG